MTQAIISEAEQLLGNPFDYPGLPERRSAAIEFYIRIDFHFYATWAWSVYADAGTFYVRRLIWEQASDFFVLPRSFGSESYISSTLFTELIDLFRNRRFTTSDPPGKSRAYEDYILDNMTYNLEYLEDSAISKVSWWNDPPPELEPTANWLNGSVRMLNRLLPKSTIWPFDELASITNHYRDLESRHFPRR